MLIRSLSRSDFRKARLTEERVRSKNPWLKIYLNYTNEFRRMPGTRKRQCNDDEYIWLHACKRISSRSLYARSSCVLLNSICLLPRDRETSLRLFSSFGINPPTLKFLRIFYVNISDERDASSSEAHDDEYFLARACHVLNPFRPGNFNCSRIFYANRIRENSYNKKSTKCIF